MDTEQDNDFIGIVFGYQSSSKFYTAMWKKSGQVYWDRKPFYAASATGMTIKVRLQALLRTLYTTSLSRPHYPDSFSNENSMYGNVRDIGPHEER